MLLLKGEDTDQRVKQNAAKKKKDTRHMFEQWPETPDIKHAVKQAMVDLRHLATSYDGDMEQLAAMNKLVLAIIHYNEFAGRSGEWSKLSAKHFHEQIKKGKHILVCEDHKTAYYYGDVGKYLSPGTLKAMLIYDSAFVGEFARANDLFFQPCCGKKVSISYYLRKFAGQNFPELLPPTSNLLRKRITSIADSHARQNKCFEMLQAYDKHGEAAMKGTYICVAAEEDAEYGQFIFKEVRGSLAIELGNIQF